MGKHLPSGTERLTVMERKLDSFEAKYDALNANITKQEKLISELETELDSKIPYQDHYDLLGRIESLEKEAVQREAYSKRMNLLIHGIDEKTDNVWETKAETTEIFNKFLINGLQLDPAKISLIDIHRLPQYLVTKNKVKITRPIIIKLAYVTEKQLIMNNLKKLKACNEQLNQQDSQQSNRQLGNSHGVRKRK